MRWRILEYPDGFGLIVSSKAGGFKWKESCWWLLGRINRRAATYDVCGRHHGR